MTGLSIQSSAYDCGERQEEPEDILSAFLGIAYDYTAITHADAGSAFTYTYPGLNISLSKAPSREKIDGRSTSYPPIRLMLHAPDTQARNWELHASSIWASSVFLADHIDELGLEAFTRVSQPPTVDRMFEVLELGAGAGLPGLVVAKYLERIEEDAVTSERRVKSWRITLSDYPDTLLIDTLRENVRRNGFSDEAESMDLPSNQSRLRVVPHAWGDDISAFCSSKSTTGQDDFDLIIAADTIWNVALHNAFAQTLYLLLRRSLDARAHLVAGLHTGRYALSGFLRALRSVDSHDDKADNDDPKVTLEVLDISERQVCGGARREWSEDRDGEDDLERRRWIVWIVLGWVNL